MESSLRSAVCNLKSAICNYFLLAIALGLFAAIPFLTRAGLPHQTDAELHIYRAAELGHLLRQGVFYPRWAPDLYLGYGYPIFNYYAPLTYYLANLFDLLPGLNIVGGVKGVFILGLVAASLGSYLLGRDILSPHGKKELSNQAGIIAAATFTFAPYIVFIDPHARGDLAEHFAVCLLPLTFYFFRRIMNGEGGSGVLLGSVFSLSALVFSHNLLGLVSSCLLLTYWVWEILTSRKARNSAKRGVLVFALAAAIIAFFWLPMLWERNAVKLNVIGPGHFDFRQHFLSLSELLAPSCSLDWGATAPRFHHNLGLAQWLLALPGLGLLLYSLYLKLPWTNRPAKTSPVSQSSALFPPLAAAGFIFLMLPASKPIWEHVPVMPYLQFPWRLLGPTNLMLSICAAIGVSILPNEGWRDLALAVTLASILLLALPLLYPLPWAPDFGGTAPLDIIQWELESLAFGTTSTGDFLPVEAAHVPMHPAETLLKSYQQSGQTEAEVSSKLLDRVNRATLPEGATVEIVEHRPLYDRFEISTPKSFVLRLFTFNFPGWHAYIDGPESYEEVEIETADPEGFITLWVPKGEHEIVVRFEDTLPRKVGWGVSIIGLIALLIASVRFADCESKNDKCGAWLPPDQKEISKNTLYWLVGVLVMVLVFKEAFADPQGWLHLNSSPGQATAAQHEVKANFGGELELLGYDLPQSTVRSGKSFSIVLYWHTLEPLEKNYQAFVHVARPLHVLWGQEDHLNPGGLPTTRWPMTKYIWDEYDIQVLPGTPPGEYAINVGLYSAFEGYRLQRRNSDGQVVGDSLIIDGIEVKRPLQQPRLSELDMTEEPLLAFPEGGLTLLGYKKSHSQTTSQDAWALTLFWRADQAHLSAQRREVMLIDEKGEMVNRYPGEVPVDGNYPFKAWRSGEVVRDQLIFPPTELSPGIYRLGLTVHAAKPLVSESGMRQVPLGTVEYIPTE
jgi:hypothetical protein